MKTPMTTVAVLAALLAAGAPRAASADADAAHAQAVDLYKEGKYEEALQLFVEANEAAPNPVTLFNIARCHDKLGKTEDAYVKYREYVETKDKAKLKKAKEAMKVIEEMDLALDVVVDPPGAVIFLDGASTSSGVSPLTLHVKAGWHTVVVKKKGFKDAREEVELPFGAARTVTVTLEEKGGAKKKAAKEETKPLSDSLSPLAREKIGVLVSGALGVTASTSSEIGSYVDVQLWAGARIKRFGVGLSLDNLFFGDSYLMIACPSFSYTLDVYKNVSLVFGAGFGAAWLYSSQDAGDYRGRVLLEAGHHWDLAVQASFRIRYKAGPLHLVAVPAGAAVLVGVGDIGPAPLAQFTFLVGVAWDK